MLSVLHFMEIYVNYVNAREAWFNSINSNECIVNHSIEPFCQSIINSSKISCNYKTGIDR